MKPRSGQRSTSSLPLTTPTSSVSLFANPVHPNPALGQVLWGLWVHNTISLLNLPLLESSLTTSLQRASLQSTMLLFSSALFLMPLTTSTIIALSTETSKVCLISSLSLSFHPYHRPKNILYYSKDPNSDIVIVDFGMWVPYPFPTPLFLHLFHRAKLLYSPDKQLISLTGSFGYVAPKVIKNTGHGKPIDIWSTGNLHTHANKLGSLSLCTAIITYILLCGYSSFHAGNTTTLAQQTANPKIEFQSPCWNSISEQAKSFIWRLTTVNLLCKRTPHIWLQSTPCCLPTQFHCAAPGYQRMECKDILVYIL